MNFQYVSKNSRQLAWSSQLRSRSSKLRRVGSSSSCRLALSFCDRVTTLNRMINPESFTKVQIRQETGLGPSNSHFGPVYPRRVRAPGLHEGGFVGGVGRVPSPGVPISSIMRIAAWGRWDLFAEYRVEG